jgi:hypothetical protein
VEPCETGMQASVCVSYAGAVLSVEPVAACRSHADSHSTVALRPAEDHEWPASGRVPNRRRPTSRRCHETRVVPRDGAEFVAAPRRETGDLGPAFYPRCVQMAHDRGPCSRQGGPTPRDSIARPAHVRHSPRAHVPNAPVSVDITGRGGVAVQWGLAVGERPIITLKDVPVVTSMMQRDSSRAVAVRLRSIQRKSRTALARAQNATRHPAGGWQRAAGVAQPRN